MVKVFLFILQIGRRVDWRPTAHQGPDLGDASDRDHPRKVGHYHAQEHGPLVHPARPPRYYRRSAPAPRRPWPSHRVDRLAHHPPDRADPGAGTIAGQNEHRIFKKFFIRSALSLFRPPCPITRTLPRSSASTPRRACSSLTTASAPAPSSSSTLASPRRRPSSASS